MPMQILSSNIPNADRNCGNCDLAGTCLFDQKRMGGFKGRQIGKNQYEPNKPHYIAYRLITDSIENGQAKEDTTTCFNFVEVLQTRMLAGRALVDMGKDGERIKIVAQEGGDYECRTRVGVNSMGEIVRPPAEMVAALKASGHKVSTSDHSMPVNWKEVTYRAQVPFYEEVINRVNTYGQSILNRELAEANIEDEAEDQAWEAAQQRMKARETSEPVTVPDTSNAHPVAEPVRRGPGRPPKVQASDE